MVGPSYRHRPLFRHLYRRRERQWCDYMSGSVSFGAVLLLLYVATRRIVVVTALAPLSSRREWMLSSVSSVILSQHDDDPPSLSSRPPPANAAILEELPLQLRPYTALAPLDKRPAGGGAGEEYQEGASTPKLTNLPVDELAVRLTHDLTYGSTDQGPYFLTGDLSPELFREDCTFVDPTNSVSDLNKYRNALRILFDPKRSYVDIIEPLTVAKDEGADTETITGRVRLGGVLRLPWDPVISSVESTIIYRVSSEDGLIYEQAQTWDVPASEVLRQTFTPSLRLAPYSTVPTPKDEPWEVTQLFHLVNGRRQNDFRQDERFAVAKLIDDIVSKQYEWKKDLLPGKWVLAYLQPGPNGEGIDRRVPFPDLPFNDNYQVFTSDTVTNIGELLGSWLEVRVSGSLHEVDVDSVKVPKRFVAAINRGDLCLGGVSSKTTMAIKSLSSDKCVQLPISGEGLFDGVYLGERLRIGQNLNGGGARVVQVKIA